MVRENTNTCPICGGRLKYYDTVKRLVRTGYGQKYRMNINRFICINCHRTHRVIPEDIIPYKHYERHIIEGFINGSLTSYNIKYEDYPSESIINEWIRTQKLQQFL